MSSRQIGLYEVCNHTSDETKSVAHIGNVIKVIIKNNLDPCLMVQYCFGILWC